MLSSLGRSNPRLMGRHLVWLLVVGTVAMALPTVYVLPLRASAAQQRNRTLQDLAQHLAAAQAGKPSAGTPEYLPRPSAAELKIISALEKPVSLQFKEKALGEVLKHLSQLAGVNMFLDNQALADEGLTKDTPVTVDLKDIRVESALRELLGQHNITYLVANDVLKITTLLQAGNTLFTRTYPVGDLCRQPEDYDELLAAIENTAVPNCWSKGGGSGTAVTVKASSSLVINQTYQVHGSILQLLRDLREARKKAELKPEGDKSATRFPNVRSQIAFVNPVGMKVAWEASESGPNRTFLPGQFTVPGRYNFDQGAIYRLKLTEVPGHAGVPFYPTLEVAPSTPQTDAFLTHNPIPIEFTDDDFDQVLAGNLVIKVIYLPDPKHQELGVAGVGTLVSTRLDPGVDPIAEADRRGTILAILRLGGIDLENAAEPQSRPERAAPPRRSADTADLVWRRLGLRLTSIEPGQVQRFQSQLRGGMSVQEVQAGGPAAAAGLQAGDILLGLHKWETLNHENVVFVLSQHDLRPSEALSAHVLRDGDRHELQLRLATSQAASSHDGTDDGEGESAIVAIGDA